MRKNNLLKEAKIYLEPEWKEFRLPVVLNRDAAPGDLRIELMLGGEPSTYEFSGFTLMKFDPASNPQLDELHD